MLAIAQPAMHWSPGRPASANAEQSNWPVSLNYPELSVNTGKSVVIGPGGDIAFALPRAEAGLAVFTLGNDIHDWQRQT